MKVVDGMPDFGKCFKVDFDRKSISYRVVGMQGVDPPQLEQLPTSFNSVDCVNAALEKFHKAIVCCGIQDDKYRALQGQPIATGVFEHGVWRSKRYLNITCRWLKGC